MLMFARHKTKRLGRFDGATWQMQVNLPHSFTWEGYLIVNARDYTGLDYSNDDMLNCMTDNQGLSQSIFVCSAASTSP